MVGHQIFKIYQSGATIDESTNTIVRRLVIEISGRASIAWQHGSALDNLHDCCFYDIILRSFSTHNAVHRLSTRSLLEDHIQLIDLWLCQSTAFSLPRNRPPPSFLMAIAGIPKSMLSAQVVEVIKSSTLNYE